jgi:hypothetical protein
MKDASRIRTLLPELAPAQAVHYASADDLTFIEGWVTYLRDHDRISNTVRTTRLDAGGTARDGSPRLVVTTFDGSSDRGEILRIGQSLLLHKGQLRVLDTTTLYAQFREIGDPLAGRLPAPALPAQHGVVA